MYILIAMVDGGHLVVPLKQDVFKAQTHNTPVVAINNNIIKIGFIATRYVIIFVLL